MDTSAPTATVFEMLEKAQKELAPVYFHGLQGISDTLDRDHIEAGYEALQTALNALKSTQGRV